MYGIGTLFFFRPIAILSPPFTSFHGDVSELLASADPEDPRRLADEDPGQS